MRIYISIPITGHSEAAQRKKALNMELRLRAMGHVAINPFKLGDEARRIEKRDLTWHEYMVIDLYHLKTHAEAVVFMKGWPESRGCVEEFDCAIKHGKLVFTEESTQTI